MDRSNPIDETSAAIADTSVVQGGAIDVVVEGYDAVYAAISESAHLQPDLAEARTG
jgi:hypothetical protein